jgi:hypothetical protein
MTPIEPIDHSSIIQEVADAYDEWKQHYGVPRSKTAMLQMVDDILRPVLDRLSNWEAYENAAQATLKDIKNLISNNEQSAKL